MSQLRMSILKQKLCTKPDLKIWKLSLESLIYIDIKIPVIISLSLMMSGIVIQEFSFSNPAKIDWKIIQIYH